MSIGFDKSWGDVATWAGALVSLAAAIWTAIAARRADNLSRHANEIAYNAWVDEYFRSVRAWGDEVSNAIQLGRIVGELPPSQERADRVAVVLASLSSLADRGRWHFPNEWHDKYGLDKKPAYRGFRQPVVTAVIQAHRTLRQVDSMAAATFHHQMVAYQRDFISEIQKVIDPRSRAREVNRIKRRFADAERMRGPVAVPGSTSDC